MTDFDKIYGRYHESRQKFDYFITGLSAAILAYSVQSFDAGKYTSFVWLAPIALCFFVIAVIAGLMRLEWIVAVLGIETEKNTKQTMYQNIHKDMSKSLLDSANLQKISKGLPDELTVEGMERRGVSPPENPYLYA